MKNSLAFILLILGFLLPNIAHSEQQTITLKDGSQIRGELVGVGNGKYNVQTQQQPTPRKRPPQLQTCKTYFIQKRKPMFD